MEGPAEALEKTWELCQRVEFSLDRARLERGLLEPIACLLGAESAVFRVFSSNSTKPTFLLGLGMPDAVHDAYLHRYFKLDPIGDLAVRRFGGPLFADLRRPGHWLDGSASTTGARRRCAPTASMIARYRANFHQYRKEFLSPYNLYHHLGFCFQDFQSQRTFVLNLIRGRESSAFGRLELARARIVGTLLHARAAQFAPGRFADNDCGVPAGERRDEIDERCAGHSACDTEGFDWRLSARELEVAESVARGLTNKEVGAALSISVRTVENHMRSIFSKLEINTRTRLAAKLHEVKTSTSTNRSTVT